MTRRSLAVLMLAFAGCFSSADPVRAKERALEPRLRHLRVGAQREWSDFPEQADGESLTLTFQAVPNEREWTLRVRQLDVRQAWKVLLNAKEIGRLATDENDMAVAFRIPAGTVQAGENRLLIEQ